VPTETVDKKSQNARPLSHVLPIDLSSVKINHARNLENTATSLSISFQLLALNHKFYAQTDHVPVVLPYVLPPKVVIRTKSDVGIIVALIH
jgi:hypothetical protein